MIGRRLVTAAAAVTLLTFSLASLSAPVAEAATPSVINCNDSGAGSLRQAVADAAVGDTITFGPTLSCSTITLTGGNLVLSKDLTISGPGAANLTVSGGGTTTVFRVGPGVTVTISGLTVDDATSANAGGAIVNQGWLTLRNCTVSGSRAPGGAGIWNQGQTGTVTRPTLTLTDSTVSNNTATGAGGAILNSAGTVTISDSTLSGNTATTAGAIQNNGSLSISDSTLSGNAATFGGAIYNGGTAAIANSTLAGNTATGRSGHDSGGGIYNDASPADLTIAATLMAGNAPGDDCSGGGTDLHDNLDDDGTCGFDDATDHSDTSAGLDPSGLEDNGGPTLTIALLATSAAVGAVDNASFCSAPDQRGVARATPCAIGAYEPDAGDQPQSITFTSTAPSGAVVGGSPYAPTATASSGLPVDLTVDASAAAVCSWAAPNVTFTGPGTCTLDAAQPGDATYAAAPDVHQSFGVQAATAPAFVMPSVRSVRAGRPFTWTLVTTGTPRPTITVAPASALPTGVTLTDNGNGTATLAGTPPVGRFPFSLTATNGAGTETIPFTLVAHRRRHHH
ncbi:MAG TPA: choice-of-anchor Q domain-containing protein [Acidimicrobiales bacterium]|nr:choice-of-anchor Q domain-containing protein [Acidimicrobiales bacterium]